MAAREPGRRKHRRQATKLPSGFRLGVPSPGGERRAVMAELIDASEGGLGLATYAFISAGTIVELDGDLKSPDLALRVSGRARVKYAVALDRGRFRIGIEFIEAAYARAS